MGVDHTGVIVAHARTDATGDDATTGVELIEAVNDDLASVTGDAAYDTVGFSDGRWCADSARWASSGRHVDHRDRRRVMISM